MMNDCDFLVKDTPVETYTVFGHPVLVKREDLCGVGDDAPPFSKIRGLIQRLADLRDRGVRVVGYTETSISMAGWGVAWACKLLDMTAVIFDPQYKDTPEVLAYHRTHWKKHGAVIEPIKAGMAKVNWYVSKRKLYDKYGPGAVLLPLGLPFSESIEATAHEVKLTLTRHPVKSIVVVIGSGTIAAGVWQGVEKYANSATIYGIMGRTGSWENKLSLIAKKAGLYPSGFFAPVSTFHIFDPGWEYTDKSKTPCPFPCHPYYDLKAWEWLVRNIESLPQPVLFWNIGH